MHATWNFMQCTDLLQMAASDSFNDEHFRLKCLSKHRCDQSLSDHYNSFICMPWQGHAAPFTGWLIRESLYHLHRVLLLSLKMCGEGGCSQHFISLSFSSSYLGLWDAIGRSVLPVYLLKQHADYGSMLGNLSPSNSYLKKRTGPNSLGRALGFHKHNDIQSA